MARSICRRAPICKCAASPAKKSKRCKTNCAPLGLLDADARAEAVRNVVPSPLAGFDPSAPLDARPLVAALEALLAREKALHDLPAKFGFSVDGGGGCRSTASRRISLFPRCPMSADVSAVRLGGRFAGVSRPQNLAPPPKASRAISCACAGDRRMGALVARLGVAPLLRRRRRRRASAAMSRIPSDRSGGRAAGLRKNPRPAALRRAESSSAPACCSGGSRPTRWSFWRDEAQDFGAAELRLTPWRAILAVGLDAGGGDHLAARLGARASCSTRAIRASPSPPVPARRPVPRRVGDVRALALALAPHWRRRAGRIHVSGCAKGCALHAPRAHSCRRTATALRLVDYGFARDEPGARARPRRPAGRLIRSAQGSAGLTAYDYIRDGAEIYRNSFAIIRREADLARFDAEEERVAVRVIHACGMVDIARAICISRRGAAKAGIEALAAGAPILCDANMVAHGVTRARLPTANEVICTLTDPRVPSCAKELGTTRTAAAMELWRAASRRRGRGVRQCADGLVPSARNARRRRAAPGADHRHAGRLRRRGGIEGGGRSPTGAFRSSPCAAARAAAPWRRPRSTLSRAKRNEHAPAGFMASGSAPAIPNFSRSRPCG